MARGLVFHLPARLRLRLTQMRERGVPRRLHLLAMLMLRAAFQTRHRAPASDPWAGVVIVVHTAFGMGGTIRSAVSQANSLARQGVPVTLVSVTRGMDQTEPFFAVDRRVVVRVLDDPQSVRRGVGARVLNLMPSVLFHPSESRVGRMSLRRDLLLVRELFRIRTGCVLTTRAGLNAVAAIVARRQVLVVGQEHVPLTSYTAQMRQDLARAYRRLDVLVVLTPEEQHEARAMLPGRGAVIRVVPNPMPDSPYTVCDARREVVVTAGRFSRIKRHDLLVRAFASLADEWPHWSLRIYGDGPRRRRLESLIERVDPRHRIQLPGASRELGHDLAEASIFVLTSDQEAFGIVLLEAMRSGLAVVSTDADHGPRNIISDGVDGVLIPVDDVDALRSTLDGLMRSPDQRRELGRAARRTAERYEASLVTGRLREIIDDAAAARPPG